MLAATMMLRDEARPAVYAARSTSWSPAGMSAWSRPSSSAASCTGASCPSPRRRTNAVRIYTTRYPDRLPRHGKDAHGRTLHALEDVEPILAARRAHATIP